MTGTVKVELTIEEAKALTTLRLFIAPEVNQRNATYWTIKAAEPALEKIVEALQEAQSGR